MNDFFTFTKGERVAIIVLAAVIFLIIAANFFVAKRPSNVNFYLHNLDSIWALHDKSKDESLKTKEFLSRQVTKSPSHQVKTKSLNVSKSELNSQKPKAKSQKLKANSPKPIVNLNSTDTTELKSLPGIGSFFARNIVEYREELGGYVEINQLLEVYAFDSSRLETITPYINIDSISLRKINVNADDFKIILRHPYIEYEDVKKIVNHREKRGFIKNWEEYLKVVGRNDVDERLRWYLVF
ncbi:MAG: helix-hairpin-helix domain-containing protein [Bacteroidales bacterium]|nr:helix-hairpin-helix domain-containing protein [Bacteroidales bacterium]